MDSHIKWGILIMKSFAKIEALAKKNAQKFNASLDKKKNTKEAKAKAFVAKCNDAVADLIHKKESN